ncbi:hypothetical protein [Paenibacillus silvae]|uniref:hypothetical protein n=1 Tax=Paenibacillus silvae TaxID=1325358 RepID=UPI0020054C6B|nr:hypothetical protein [Paenibacillus silvae]MCK6076722.1 hypothetical protein [Paenibacillus silvae]MCK6151149.1 hypothetical protein [Paenibacillus silvae]MCK6269408.1 hypothetical protein [Paenibacillus silvae]
MELALYVLNKQDTKQLATLLMSAIQLFSPETRMISKDDYYTLMNANFSCIVQDDDELVSFTREELSLNINFCISITIFSHSPEEALRVIFQAINRLIAQMDKDIALTDSASGVIFLRSNGQLVINSHCQENPDIYDWPYNLLEGDFIEKDMAGLL